MCHTPFHEHRWGLALEWEGFGEVSKQFVGFIVPEDISIIVTAKLPKLGSFCKPLLNLVFKTLRGDSAYWSGIKILTGF